MTSSGLLTEALNTTSRAFSGGTVDLMSAFRTLERRTGSYVESTPMHAERRAELVGRLIAWSTGEPDNYDWSLVEASHTTAPDDFQP